MPYETFDIDLRDGKAREDAFVHVMLRSKVEHKRDKKAARTGNVAIEIAQTLRGGETVESGVMATTAGVYAIEFFPECWLVVPVEYVKRLARMAVQQDRKAWIGDGNNHLNALVPIEWFRSSAARAEGRLMDLLGAIATASKQVLSDCAVVTLLAAVTFLAVWFGLPLLRRPSSKAGRGE